MITALVFTMLIPIVPTPGIHQATPTVQHQQQASEAAYASSRNASDLRGFQPSLYRGKWYSPKSEKIRECIMRRESHHNYSARNRSSSARGAYQFLDNSWRSGLVWMFLAESKETRDGLGRHALRLRGKPISTWDRYWQDRAFWTAWRNGAGRHHWNYPQAQCW